MIWRIYVVRINYVWMDTKYLFHYTFLSLIDKVIFDDMLTTVWSAPNYCYRAGNLASVLEIHPGLSRYFNIFGACPESEREIPGVAKSSLRNVFDEEGEAAYMTRDVKGNTAIQVPNYLWKEF